MSDLISDPYLRSRSHAVLPIHQTAGGACHNIYQRLSVEYHTARSYSKTCGIYHGWKPTICERTRFTYCGWTQARNRIADESKFSRPMCTEYRSNDEKMLDEGFECGIEVITIYAFSLENFHRPKEQVYDLMVLLKGFVSQFAPQSPLVKKFDLKLRVVGRVELLEEDFRKIVQETADRLKNNRGKILNVCLAYTARDEITTAISKTATSCVSTGEITAKALSDNMFIGSPAPDLLIRSSGVHRLSDFLLWQCHQNTVIEIVDVKWPEFGMRAMGLILLKWQRRRKSCILPEAQEKEKTPG